MWNGCSECPVHLGIAKDCYGYLQRSADECTEFECILQYILFDNLFGGLDVIECSEVHLQQERHLLEVLRRFLHVLFDEGRDDMN